MGAPGGVAPGTARRVIQCIGCTGQYPSLQGKWSITSLKMGAAGLGAAEIATAAKVGGAGRRTECRHGASRPARAPGPPRPVLRTLVGTAVALAVVIEALAVIVAVRNGRRVRRLDRRLAAIADLPPELARPRAWALRHRESVSQGWLPRRPSPARPAALGLMGVAALAAAGVGGWSLIAPASQGPTRARAAAKAPRPLPPDPRTVVPVRPAALAVPTRAFRVTILNASGIRGAAGRQAAPRIRAGGFRLRRIGNAPVSSLRTSVVMWSHGRRLVAVHVARRLGIRRIAPIDGLSSAFVRGADAVVVLGRDRPWRRASAARRP
jgi:hypothetical protein